MVFSQKAPENEEQCKTSPQFILNQIKLHIVLSFLLNTYIFALSAGWQICKWFCWKMRKTHKKKNPRKEISFITTYHFFLLLLCCSCLLLLFLLSVFIGCLLFLFLLSVFIDCRLLCAVLFSFLWDLVLPSPKKIRIF